MFTKALNNTPENPFLWRLMEAAGPSGKLGLSGYFTIRIGFKLDTDRRIFMASGAPGRHYHGIKTTATRHQH